MMCAANTIFISCGGFSVFIKKTSESSGLFKLFPSDPSHLYFV